ncbi:MAG: 1-acyl-sn-glycerol-3-phosphate acyltransferase [Synergistetes bacterium]|nr:1-acyl-sn-glycerol-3-phosphate acyltransferase [Synergistota bacterium]MCX8127509.1 1-acyl-sn-glycerol-3-phosphate acyltransferase [Synergistota bacterium]MDW8191575.1 lysophospholipid acyltransferase family protein [Synergistota bacterium]
MFYNIIKVLAFFILKLFFFIEAKGRKNIPKDGGLLVISNHCSQMDPVIIGAVFPRRLYYMGKEELFKIPFLRSLIVSLGAFPVKRGEGDLKALSRIIELVDQGKAVLLFPEGSRSEDGELKDFMHGASYVAFKTSVPVLPVAVKGSFEAMPKGQYFPRPTKIKVSFGKVLYFKGRGGKSIREEIKAFTNDLRENILMLLKGEI